MRQVRVLLLALTGIAAMAGNAAAQDAAASAAGLGTALASEQLADFRGGSEMASSEMRLAGTTADNSATNVATGANTISAGSFANMSGIPVVIQNSGANVLIQNATIVNLHLN
jgi:hypothetical protein